MAAEIRNINIQFIDLPADITMIPISRSPEIQHTDLTAAIYYLPISNQAKILRAKLLMTFTSEEELYILQNDVQVHTIDHTKLADYFNAIHGKVGYIKHEIVMNLMQFSLIPAENIQNQNLKCWGDLYIVFDPGSQKATIYGKQRLVEKIGPFLLKDFTSNIEKYTAYFALGRELALSLDYLIMRNYGELKNALIRVNTLLTKLGIEFQFDTADNKMKTMHATELEYLQNQILSAHI